MPASRPGVPQGGPPGSIDRVRAELETDIRRVEEESAEIDMLMEQVLVEVERHESRRSKLEERLSALDSAMGSDPQEVKALRDSLLTLTRRAMLFDAQRQVLEGKQRVLARFLQRLVEIDNSLAQLTGPQGRPMPSAPEGFRPMATGPNVLNPSGVSEPVLRLRNQEDLRRDIVRQLHDGPAQNLANIALQTEIVERLVKRQDERGQEELESLRRMVQQALNATKEFIFEVRPMVLDDLGLVPTLRRATVDRSRRSGIAVDFDSQGTERRLSRDLESALFRNIDEAVGGFLLMQPPSVVVRLDWSETEMVATVEATWQRPAPDQAANVIATGSSRQGDTPPVLLAMMEEKRSVDRQALVVSRSLSAERVAEIGQRARALGMALTLRDDGQVLELVVPISRHP